MPAARISILPDEPIGLINPNLYGHFAEHLGTCVNGGVWVGEDSAIPNTAGLRDDLVEAFRRIRPPVIRWPGGCFADDYHWADGVGPRRERPKTVNTWWGGGVEDNAFGTHEFITFCRLVGAQPYLAGNLGSGSVREMRDWVEYCNHDKPSTLAMRRAANGSPMPMGVKYWGVGNEAWGCGGNFCPEDYAAEYKRYATYLRDFGGTPVFLIACGPDGNQVHWTRRFLKKIASADQRFNCRIHGLGAHYYCGTAGTATEYSTDQWYELLQKAAGVERLILDQRAVLDEFDPERRIGLILDEWGTWHPPTPGRDPCHLWQQNTLRDALVAAITLDTFNRHADKAVMANIAQAVNVLQALVIECEVVMTELTTTAPPPALRISAAVRFRIVSAVRASFLKRTFFMAACRASRAPALRPGSSCATPRIYDAHSASCRGRVDTGRDCLRRCRRRLHRTAEPSGVRDTPSAW